LRYLLVGLLRILLGLLGAILSLLLNLLYVLLKVLRGQLRLAGLAQCLLDFSLDIAQIEIDVSLLDLLLDLTTDSGRHGRNTGANRLQS